ncbi:MAG: polyprenyl synthetase family protein [Candidatus Bathyarchaeota archaeon]|nr:polyprenyl synthetase family protein [Candidatus Bathyarchaeota archaeon]MDH5779610.1 polyprenyl synthetase family protein [Candidatus Bathyarchaeota archaeon]
MRYVSPKESEKTRANNETKMIEQVQRFLEERSREALQIAKKKILKGKMESEEIKDAFRYYTKDWKDVIHPGLLSIACEAAGGDVDKSVPIQVVMLLLTAGADIHDDIIDESKTKYGKPTVLASFGKNIALLVGDAFLMKALVLLHQLENQFPTAKMNAIWTTVDSRFFELGNAEALEALWKGNMDLSVEEYWRILTMKAATFEAHARIGAIIGGGKQKIVDLLANYGRTLGILLSIREDFIDVFEPTELQNRMKNECLPLPILYAFKNPQTKKAILNYLSKKEISEKDAATIVDILFEEENVEVLRNQVKQLAEEACTNISHVPNKNLVYQMETLIRGAIEDL